MIFAAEVGVGGLGGRRGLFTGGNCGSEDTMVGGGIKMLVGLTGFCFGSSPTVILILVIISPGLVRDPPGWTFMAAPADLGLAVTG